ncbi:MAG: hypothetical protein K8J08_02160, partial [Thermoanaerobaculia bacterium]|nr:hypothetical protein [Thermoanaerobaculia bacterium]
MAAQSSRSRLNWAAALTLGLALLQPSSTLAQDSAAEFEAAFRSGESTRCMEAGNRLSDYKQFAADLAAPLFDVVEGDSICAGNALSGLINLGRDIRDGVPAERAVPHLISLIEKGLLVSHGPPASLAESSMSLLGYFGADASSAVPILERVVHEREDDWSKRSALS